MITCLQLAQVVLIFMNHSLKKLRSCFVFIFIVIFNWKNFLLVSLVKENVSYSYYFICHNHPPFPKHLEDKYLHQREKTWTLEWLKWDIVKWIFAVEITAAMFYGLHKPHEQETLLMWITIIINILNYIIVTKLKLNSLNLVIILNMKELVH